MNEKLWKLDKSFASNSSVVQLLQTRHILNFLKIKYYLGQ